MKTKIFLVVFCLILLAAHFFRDGNIILMAASVCAPLLFAYKNRLSITILQIVLILGSIEWIFTTYSLTQSRIELGTPWVRMVGILSAVILLTLYSAQSLNSKKIKAKYK